MKKHKLPVLTAAALVMVAVVVASGDLNDWYSGATLSINNLAVTNAITAGSVTIGTTNVVGALAGKQATGSYLTAPVANASLANSTITMNGASVALGGSFSQTNATLASLGGIATSLLTAQGDIITRSASAPQALALGSFGKSLQSDATDTLWFDGRGLINLWEEFLNWGVNTAVANGPFELLTAVVGSGASITSLASPANAPGIIQFITGSTTNGNASASTAITSFLFGGGHAYLEIRVRVPVLSAATDLFEVYAGFGDVTAAGNMVDGVYFIYSSSANSYTNTTKWSGITANNSARTEVPSSTTVGAGTFYVLGIDVNAAGSLVTFYIDGASIGTSSTNIPTAANRETGIVLKLSKLGGSTGTTSLKYDVDYMHLIQRTTR